VDGATAAAGTRRRFGGLLRGDRRAGLIALGLALPLIVVARLALPTAAPPLYDGLIAADPYRFLNPPLIGGHGDPTSFQEPYEVTGSTVPAIAAATLETPPQAQFVAPDFAFEVNNESTTLDIQIVPVEPPADVPGKAFAGNVYTIRVAEDGNNLQPVLPVTVSLSAPGQPDNAEIAYWDGFSWTLLPTESGNQIGTFVAEVEALGEFAVVVPPNYNVIITIGLIALGLLGLAAWLYRDYRRSRDRKAGRQRTDEPVVATAGAAPKPPSRTASRRATHSNPDGAGPDLGPLPPPRRSRVAPKKRRPPPEA
jgi:hypothetical protein